MTPDRRCRENGFTLLEIVVATTILGAIAVLALPVLQGFTVTSRAATERHNARALVTAVNLYRIKTGNAIAGVSADPMTLARANAIYAQIDGPINAAGEVIVEDGFALNANATFPHDWGELGSGVFEAVP